MSPKNAASRHSQRSGTSCCDQMLPLPPSRGRTGLRNIGTVVRGAGLFPAKTWQRLFASHSIEIPDSIVQPPVSCDYYGCTDDAADGPSLPKAARSSKYQLLRFPLASRYSTRGPWVDSRSKELGLFTAWSGCLHCASLQHKLCFSQFCISYGSQDFIWAALRCATRRPLLIFVSTLFY